MEIFSIILVILLVARICAEIAQRFGQPPLVGELVAGILIGYVISEFGRNFGITMDFAEKREFTVITDLGIFFLMLLAGIELGPKEMREASSSAFFIAAGGLLLPLLLGMGLGYIAIPGQDYKTAQVLFIGTAMAITAVPLAVRVLMDLDMLDTPLGRRVVSAAVIDDVLSLMLLAVLTGMIKSGEMPSLPGVSLLVLKVVVFFGICWVLGKYVFPPFGKLLKKTSIPEGDFSGLLIMGLAFALLAKLLGLHFIIGAFFAGLMFRTEHVGVNIFKNIEKRVSGITTGFLAPLFFASVGLHVTLGAFVETPLFTLSLLILAVIGKMLGAGIPAYLQSKNPQESAAIGIAMNGRGAVELVILDIALRADLFDYPVPIPPVIENLFSSIVIMAIVTTIMTPVALKAVLKKS